MQELIKITENEQGKKITSAKELYLGLELNKSNWSRWYPTNIENNEFFLENIDWIGVRRYDEGNETKDFAITLEFAKHLAMMSKTKKSHDYRNYFIECEKQLKQESQFKLPINYKEALLQLVEQVEQNEKLQIENESLTLENRLLNKEVFTWAERPLINSLVRKYGASIGDFPKSWKEFKKSILYSYGININSRITNYLNTSNKKTKPKTLEMLRTQEEISNGIATIISMCREADIEITDILKHYSEGDK